VIKLLSIRANSFKLLTDVELRFPSTGSILIEGRNEAGKSTLFEAIFFALFGKPLPGGPTVQDLIAYQATEAVVVLEVVVRDTRLSVQRRVRRTKAGASTDARLRVFGADGENVEDVKGASAVSARLQQELKLDADAFLNSCFVEQKKLDKLEGMSARDRQESMMRLLNLDRMMADEESLRVTMDDQRAIQRVQQRVKLAEVIAEIPVVQERGRVLRKSLAVAALKETLSSLERAQRARAEAETRLAELEPPIRALEERIARIEALRSAESAANLAAAQLGKIDGYIAQIADLRADLTALDRAECQDLPALQVCRRRLGALRGLYARLLALSAEAAEAVVDAEGIRKRLAAWDVSQAAAAEAEARLGELAAPMEDLRGRIARIEALRATAGAADLAAARLGAADDARAQIVRLEAEMADLDRVEAEGLPALHARRARLGVLKSQWRRVRALNDEAKRLENEAKEAQRRLAAVEAARTETAEGEARLKAETGALAEMEARAEVLAEAEHTANLRVALEDWQAAYHAKRSLYELEGSINGAEREHAAAEAEASAASKDEARLRKAAARAVPQMAAGGILTLISFVGAALAGLPALGAIGILPLLWAAIRLAQWRQATGKANAASARVSGISQRVREAQNALLRLQGQLENAQMSQGASAGRLDMAATRFDALEERVPNSEDEAARRLEELPVTDEGPDALRDRVAALRAEIAAARAALAEQNRVAESRRGQTEADREPVLREAAERLDRRAARITHTIVDRWTEVATARAAALGVETGAGAAENCSAADRLQAQADADIRNLGARLAARPELSMRIVELQAAVDQAVAEAGAARPGSEPLLTRADAEAWKATVEADLALLDEPGARSETDRLTQARDHAERDRVAAIRDARRIEGELAARFRAQDDWAVAGPRVHVGLAALAARAERIAAIGARWADRGAARAAALGVDVADDLEDCRQAMTSAEAAAVADIRVLNDRLAGRPGLLQRVERLEAATATERANVEAARGAIMSVRPDGAALATRADADALAQGLAAEAEALDEPGARGDLDGLRRERSDAGNAHFAADKEAVGLVADMRDQALHLDYPEDAPLTREALSTGLSDWDTAEPDQRAALEEEFDALRRRNGYLTETRNDLAAALGLEPRKENVDLEREREALAELAHDHAVRKQAQEIIRLARERIVQKVLPYTIEHMRRILPAITSDRYHDARLTDDYKIEVWDERAGMWKRKDIFSGGTRDQFSLALRLAFAMATLPQERGAAPGFIFLDEPLSSFDVERSEALMYLLTKGDIAETFDQILVISHSQTFSTQEFAHRLRLDGGKVLEASDDMRPAAADEEQLALTESAGL
jgi:DNA repair exonuclease SbcCD ATPase subunit